VPQSKQCRRWLPSSYVFDEPQNRDTLTEDTASGQWSEGDACGKNGCEREVIVREHLTSAENPCYPQVEIICPTRHGIRATR